MLILRRLNCRNSRFLRLDEVVGLKAVILAIELADRLAGRRIVIPIILASLGLRLGVHGIGDEFFPGLASRDVILPVCIADHS